MMTQERLNTLKLIVVAMAVWSAAIFISPAPKYHVTTGAENRQPKAAQDENKLIWLDNYESALKEAKATGKPIFLEFRCAP